MKKIILLILIVVMMLALTSCLPGDLDESDDPAGFFWGILHGWLAPFTLILSIFKDTVKMYEIHNIGFWYNFGFYIAVIGGFGSISFTRKKYKKQKD